MSDQPDFKNIYTKSHHSMCGFSAEPAPAPPKPESMDQPVYDDLIDQGRTPEYAKEAAEHSAYVKRLYYQSQQ